LYHTKLILSSQCLLVQSVRTLTSPLKSIALTTASAASFIETSSSSPTMKKQKC
jgi:hypothetical protein